MRRARSGSVLRDIDLAAVKARSATNIVLPWLDLNSWMQRTPSCSCDEARSAKCPCCQAPSSPQGKALGLWGHWLRYRQQRGPMQPGTVPQIVTVPLRRYWCRHCHAGGSSMRRLQEDKTACGLGPQAPGRTRCAGATASSAGR